MVLLYTFAGSVLAGVPQRRKNARFQNFRLGFYPIFQFLSFHLSPLVVKLARAQTYFSLQQFQHQFLALTSSSYAIHGLHPTIYWSVYILRANCERGMNGLVTKGLLHGPVGHCRG